LPESDDSGGSYQDDGGGWVRSIEVSLSLLQEVVKVIVHDFQQDGAQRMGLS